MKNKNQIFLTILVIILLPFQSCFANQPAKKAYQIEMIIFSHLTAKALNSEQWPIVNKFNPTETAYSSLINTNQLLGQNDWLLDKEAKAIAHQKGYEILMHIAWQQSFKNPREALPIHIYGGKVFDNNGKVIATYPNGRAPYHLDGIWQIDGTIKLSVVRFIQARFNLFFTEPASTIRQYIKTNFFNSPVVYFHLLESRRMRSNELNYIGFPLYGILIKITPVEAA